MQKFVASELRTMLAQYQETKNFVWFGAELTDKTKLLFLRGTIFDELIKQDLTTHLLVDEQLMIILALMGGFYDSYPLKEIVNIRNLMIEEFRKPLGDPLREAFAKNA